MMDQNDQRYALDVQIFANGASDQHEGSNKGNVVVPAPEIMTFNPSVETLQPVSVTDRTESADEYQPIGVTQDQNRNKNQTPAEAPEPQQQSNRRLPPDVPPKLFRPRPSADQKKN